jgi:hypothetical protein
VLAQFAVRIGADQVRLADRRDQWPDGFVRVGKRTIKVLAPTVTASSGRNTENHAACGSIPLRTGNANG